MTGVVGADASACRRSPPAKGLLALRFDQAVMTLVHAWHGLERLRY
jgi:hypothetical protein